MLDTALNTIKKYNMLSFGDKVVIGVSGGADSVSLVYLLSSLKEKYSLTLFAVHVNHGIRGEEAERDALFAEALCKSLNIPFELYRFNIKTESEKLGLTDEETGRLIRYKCFYETMDKYGANKIAVAHNKNDNAETVLMRLIRGTGIKGLGGISPIRDNIIRPLICCSRKQIEAYLKENQISYINDSTNSEEIYTRNKIRLTLIPWIEKNLNRGIIETIFKTSEIMAEENAFLDGLAKDCLKECTINKAPLSLSIKILKKYDLVIKRRIIRLSFLPYSKDLHDISLKHINAVLSLMEKENGKRLNLPYGLCVIKEYDSLIFSKNTTKKEKNFNTDFLYNVIFDKIVYIKEINKYFYLSKKPLSSKSNILPKDIKPIIHETDFDKINGSLCLRSRQNGDKIFIKRFKGNKILKKILSEKKVSTEEKEKIVILSDSKEIILVCGVIVSDNYKITAKTKNKLYIYTWEEN